MLAVATVTATPLAAPQPAQDEEVALSSLTFQFKTHYGQCGIWFVGGGGGGGRFSEGSDFYTFYFVILLIKAHFVCLVACCLFRFEKLLFVFVKDENIVIHIIIHTIHLIFLAQKLCPFLHLFFVVLPFLQVEKLKHCSILLMLD